ncbi:tetratricopeptide (TPR) repeat protein [Azospirillum agricola]|uniref:glycosyltransferase n=1 Tax=Azospirillum agricola TaxID=1720247 RepID=UPI001AE782E2|nr:glycosyltransferase [Azospirillum agricola]MBP2228905.1 tetratricopeptide (TPR) repeat protein [Azospirillum agricola]
MMDDPDPMAAHRRALAADPAEAMSWQRLAFEMRQAGKAPRALSLFIRAARMHGDGAVLEQQIERVVTPALNQAVLLMQDGRIDEAAAIVEPLAGIIAPRGDLAHVLGVLRFIQGRDDEAARLHAASRMDGNGLGVALDGIARHRADCNVIGTVVIPVYRMEDTIERALDSVLAAARYHRAASGEAGARIHVCVVDDASPDDSVARALRWARAHPEQSVAVIANNRNRGAGWARNAGAAASLGRYLWFLDADDHFLERHLFLTIQALDAAPGMGFVRTGILFDEIDAEITREWRQASENCYPGNLCVRRDCHDRIGGFPEEPPFQPAVAEDVAYGRALHSRFGGLKLPEKTVRYTMRPGNALERQRAEMIGGPLSAERQQPDSRFVAIELLTQRRLYGLAAEAARRPPPTDAAAWLEKGKELIRERQPEVAVAVLVRAAALDPASATVWFELGLAANGLKRDALALRAFRAVASLHPDAGGARFNLASLRFEQAALDPAARHLREALALRPEHGGSLFLLGRTERRRGRVDAAHGLLRRAARIEPNLGEVRAEWAEAALGLGCATEAAEQARRALALAPDLFDGHTALAGALEALGRPDAALQGWQRAIRCNAGRGEAFTGRAVNRLVRRYGPPPAPAPRAETGRRLASTALGWHGRFGNQLLQYGVLRLYAARHGLTLEVPPWPGRHLYGLDDPLPGPAMPRLPEREVEASVVASLGGTGGAVLADRDVTAYFCGDTRFLAPHRETFRGFFTPGPHIRSWADALTGRLRAAGGTLVALHIRRGDFGWGPFWIAPESWYLRWLETVWPGLDRPVLYVATDDPRCLSAFAAYRPLHARDLAEPIPGAEFLTDFHVLCEADLVAVSNSSFSFVATMLNRRARSTVRPDRTRQALRPYDPWSSPVLL